MIDISNRLKEARINKGLTIEGVSNDIKISAEHLRNIEENNQNELPHRPYVRGFIKTYSNYLSLDTYQILEDFNESVGSTIPTPQKEQIEKDNWKSVPLINKIKFNTTTRLFLVICVLALATLAGNQIYTKYSREAIKASLTPTTENKINLDTPQILPDLDLQQNQSKAPQK